MTTGMLEAKPFFKSPVQAELPSLGAVMEKTLQHSYAQTVLVSVLKVNQSSQTQRGYLETFCLSLL